ncbi:MAG: TAXI family TRAP transporter solute-binding subunit [Pseudomonadales bacterium]|nr:TAXI family TRAP transporter solute-binding subunit [Pseudomonadales bacterium]NIX09121.1 TAXI family TRAP transporter solute-binding subunit [Pseudomonadales bacterium]
MSNQSAAKFWSRAADIAGTWGLALALLLAGLIVAYQFVGPPPPKRVVLATGEPSGAYYYFGERFAEVLARDGVVVELRATGGSVDNLELLAGDEGVDLAFVQGGIASSARAENVVTMGSLYLEPLWVFLGPGLVLDDLGDLEGRRVAVGVEGSGTRAVAMQLLEANGVDGSNAELVGVSSAGLVEALAGGEIDAAFLIGAPQSGTVRELLRVPGVRLHDMDRAEAYTRRYAFLSSIMLPGGVLDLEADLPEQDTETVAVGAMLAARDDFHPALTDLLLIAAAEIHGGHSILADAGTFPTSRFVDLPLSEEAERHYQHGAPFLMRYLPFWAATLVDRLWIMLVPLIGLSLPLARLVPPAYRWQIRRRLLRIYTKLHALDPLRTPVADDADVAERLEQLDRLDVDSTIEAVPKGYADDLYQLRRDIDLVRRRLGAARSPSLVGKNG